MGEIVTTRKLKKVYGVNFPHLIELSIVKQLPHTKKGEVRKYEVLRDKLPSHQEFSAELRNHFQTPVPTLIDDMMQSAKSFLLERR